VSDPLRVFAYEDGSACGYYRLRMPFEHLAAAGHDVVTHQYGVSETATEYPVIVAQRAGHPGFELTWLKMWRDHKLVWEADDDLWAIDPTNRRAAKRYTTETLKSTESTASLAHLVTVSTEPLAEVMRQFNPNVVVIPNHIDGALLDVERPHRDKITIGWAGGDSHERDWDYVANPLRRFLERNPDVDMHTIGSNFHRSAKIVGRARHTGWSNDIFSYYRSIDFDIGIAPLESTVFNRSKSHIKALEYAALGIPVVATHSEPYREFVIDGETGFLIRHEHEWDRRLRDLVNDEAMRIEMGKRAKERAADFVIQDGWRQWESAYRRLT